MSNGPCFATIMVCGEQSSIPCSLFERHGMAWHGAGTGTLPPIGIDGVARPALVPGVVLFVGPRVLPGKKGPMSTLRRKNSNNAF